MYFRLLVLGSLVVLTVAFQSPVDSIQKHYRAAQSLQNAGKADEARSEFRAALGEAYQQLGTVLLSQEQYPEAVKAVDRAVAIGITSEEILLAQATAYFYVQQYEKAVEPLTKALAANPRSVAAHHLLGKTYFMLKRFEQAVSELEMALKVTPTDGDISYTLALAWLKQEKLAPAQQIFNRLLQSLGNRAEVHMLFGRAYRETNFLNEAIAEFKKTAALNPKYPRVHYCLGLSMLLKDGTLVLKEAAAEFRAELATYPDEFLAMYNLGVVCVIERRYAEGASLLEKAVGLRPQNPDANLFLGNAYYGLNQFDKAIESFQKCLTLNPDFDTTSTQAAETHFMFGKSLVAVGRSDEGEKQLHMARDLKAKALSADREKIQAFMKSEEYKGGQLQTGKDMVTVGGNPTDPKMQEKLNKLSASYREVVASIHNQLGLFDAERQDFQTAAEQFHMALEWDASLPDIYYNFGLACYKAERYKEAIPALEAELKINAANITAKHLLGMCYFVTDDYARAAELLNQVIPAKPTNVGLYYTLSLSLLKQNKVQEAGEVIQKMLTMCGDSPQVHILFGQAYSQQNDDAKALAELKQATMMDSRTVMAHFYSGLIYIKQSKFDDAIREFAAELAINPGDIQTKYHLGFVQLANGQLKEGMKLMREVVAANPNYADARFELGKALLQQGDVKGAVDNLEAAVKLEPNKSYIHYQLSRAYTAAGRAADGQKSLETFRLLKEKERNRSNP